MEYSSIQILIALGITILAGMTTGLGGLSTFITRLGNKWFLSFSLGFSAGVMIFVSFFRILDEVKETLVTAYGDRVGNWYVILGFFLGVLFIVFFERLIHIIRDHKVEVLENASPSHLKYLGYFTALAISVHNFPEGFVTFAAYLDDPTLGFSIALAVAIHNIPIGIAISVPIFYATKNRKKAFWIAMGTGAVGPVGAILGYLFLMPYMNPIMFSFLMAIVAGILVVVAIDELLPTARSYGNHHVAVYGMIAGMFTMALAIMSF